VTITYRLAALVDLDILLELVQEFHQIEHLPFDEKLDRDVLDQFFRNESFGQAWLMQQETDVIGYIILTLGFSLEFRGRDAFIDELYVRPEYRNQGIGTKTLAFVEIALASLGVRAIHLEVDFENPNAQRLYRKTGYQGHNRFLLTKWLALGANEIDIQV
jgi:ribosomal protein S18 acetylase RimI-like enzyme